MSDPGSTYRTRGEVAGIRQVEIEMRSPLENHVALFLDKYHVALRTNIYNYLFVLRSMIIPTGA
jgi:hypothetical protein